MAVQPPPSALLNSKDVEGSTQTNDCTLPLDRRSSIPPSPRGWSWRGDTLFKIWAVIWGGAKLGGCQKEWFSKRVVLREFPRNENRNEGTFGCSPGTKTGTSLNEGTFACSPGPKTGTRAHSPKPLFYENALLSPSEKRMGEENVPENALSRKFLDPFKELLVCSVVDFCTGKTEH